MDFKIKQETVEGVLKYLSTRPLGEVLNIWNELHQVQPIQEDKPQDGVEQGNTEG